MSDQDTETGVVDTSAIEPTDAPVGWLPADQRNAALRTLGDVGYTLGFGRGSSETDTQEAQPPVQSPTIEMEATRALEPEGRFGDTTQAGRLQQATEGNLEADAQDLATAQFEADKQKQTRLAVAGEDYAAKLGGITEDFKRRREATEKVAAAETATWMAEMDKKSAQEPSPARWWENQSGFGKALWLLGLALGAQAQSMVIGAKNPVLAMVDEEIARDVQSQKDRLTRQMETLRARGQVMSAEHRERLSDLADDHTMAIGKINALMEAARTRALVPGPEDQQAATSKAQMWADTRKADIASQQLAARRAERLKAVEEAEANARQDALFRHQENLAQITVSGQVAAKRAELAAADKKDYPEMNADATGVRVFRKNEAQPGLLARATGTPLAGPHQLRVIKEDHNKAFTYATTASDAFDKMKTLRDHIKSAGLSTELLRDDPELNAAYTVLAYSTVRQELDPNGRISDQDAANGAKAVLGFDLDSVKGNVLSAVQKDKVVAALDKAINNMPANVSRTVQGIYGSEVKPDETVVWTPRPVNIKPGESTAASALEDMGGPHVTPPVPRNAEEFATGLANEQRFGKGTGLPPMPPAEEAKVEQFKASSTGAPVDQVRALATKALDAVHDPTARRAVNYYREQATMAAESAEADVVENLEMGMRLFPGDAVDDDDIIKAGTKTDHPIDPKAVTPAYLKRVHKTLQDFKDAKL